MRVLVAISAAGIFLALSALHLFWALGGKLAGSAAIPSTNGVAAFVPGRPMTALVAGALFAAALVVAATGEVIRLPLPNAAVTMMASLLALILAVRAVGDFRLVGMFKRANDSRFAELDTLVYSPLCALLALAILFLIIGR